MEQITYIISRKSSKKQRFALLWQNIAM